ncbi:hypothetical protein TRIUR3_00270 [Triticum urartu]|uniref:Uncharacterized protein n=1 Tax=Triticum urartu TaxID=4572 RepID=M7ZRY1_TRIUA|nr:hypothetical protein TRIUR3_00270 [Triticum urartu]
MAGRREGMEEKEGCVPDGGPGGQGRASRPSVHVRFDVNAAKFGRGMDQKWMKNGLVEDEQLPVLAADDERTQPDTERDVEPPFGAAVVEREVVVHGDEGGVLGEDLKYLVGPEHGAAEESLAAVAVELEGWRPAWRLGVLVQPERVGYAQVATCPGRAGKGIRRAARPEEGSEDEEERDHNGFVVPAGME